MLRHGHGTHTTHRRPWNWNPSCSRVPSGSEPQPNIHGRTATAFQQEEMSQMNAKADKEGFIVVHPQALGNPPTWWGPIPNEVGQPDMMLTKEGFGRRLA